MNARTIEGPAQPAAAEGSRCEAIGNIMVCLHYLSCQARAMNAPDLAGAIDRAVREVMGIGLEAYNGYVQEILRSRSNDGTGFVEDFCHVNDEAIKGELLEIASLHTRERQIGT